jgi:hypothetical protein
MCVAILRRLALGSLLCQAVIACAGELDGNPDDYIVEPQGGGGASGSTGSGGKGGGGASASGGASAGPCDAIPIFNKSCAVSFCHSNDDKAGGLDLASADVGSRLIDVAPNNADCTDGKLIDSSSYKDSFLLDKLENTKPACGDRMPYGGEPLSSTDLACVESWVQGLVSGGSGSPDAGN